MEIYRWTIMKQLLSAQICMRKVRLLGLAADTVGILRDLLVLLMDAPRLGLESERAHGRATNAVRALSTETLGFLVARHTRCSGFNGHYSGLACGLA